VIFLFGAGVSHNLLDDKPTKWFIVGKKKIKTFVLWDASKLIKLTI